MTTECLLRTVLPGSLPPLPINWDICRRCSKEGKIFNLTTFRWFLLIHQTKRKRFLLELLRPIVRREFWLLAWKIYIRFLLLPAFGACLYLELREINNGRKNEMKTARTWMDVALRIPRKSEAQHWLNINWMINRCCNSVINHSFS